MGIQNPNSINPLPVNNQAGVNQGTANLITNHPKPGTEPSTGATGIYPTSAPTTRPSTGVARDALTIAPTISLNTKVEIHKEMEAKVYDVALCSKNVEIARAQQALAINTAVKVDV
ncbi:hypothetical protein RIF29_04666 [Crotalaria pallida]|uniref:Uncharacterized protein n=1 Tax=Crotalaria pallida TaxID=3830 RepID=A0AAN9J3R7_CROPI